MAHAGLIVYEGGQRFPPRKGPLAPDTLDYVLKLAQLAFVLLGILYFLGFNGLRPFAQRHVAAV